jgi:hypothetical protein
MARFVFLAKITTGHPRSRAMAFKALSGFTATGWPTSSIIGRSEMESEYA